MDENRLKRKLEQGKVAICGGNYDDTDLIDYIGSLGVYDCVWIDMEHSPVTWRELADLSRAADLWGMTSIVRVRENEPTLISLTLSQGVDGVIVPHVNTREDAERAVDAAKFEPWGHRGSGGSRKNYGRKGDQYTRANENGFLAVMIEHYVAVDNLPEILKVPHIDCFFVSHHDLSQSLGLMHDVHNPKVTETYDRGIKLIADAGKVPGGSITEDELSKYLPMGVRFLKSSQWRAWAAAGAAAYQGKVAEQAKSSGIPF